MAGVEKDITETDVDPLALEKKQGPSLSPGPGENKK